MTTAREIFRESHLDALFSTQGEAAVYTPAGGSAVDVTVIPTKPDEILDGVGRTRIYAETALFRLRVSEVAAPAMDDTLVHNSITYYVKEQPAREDVHQLVWTLETRQGDVT